MSSVTRRRRASAPNKDSTSRTASLRSNGCRSTSCLASSARSRRITSLARRSSRRMSARMLRSSSRRSPPALEDQVGGVGVAQDRAERLVDLVRDRARQLAGDREPRRMRELEALRLLGRFGEAAAPALDEEPGRSARPGARRPRRRRSPRCRYSSSSVGVLKCTTASRGIALSSIPHRRTCRQSTFRACGTDLRQAQRAGGGSGEQLAHLCPACRPIASKLGM